MNDDIVGLMNLVALKTSHAILIHVAHDSSGKVKNTRNVGFVTTTINCVITMIITKDSKLIHQHQSRETIQCLTGCIYDQNTLGSIQISLRLTSCIDYSVRFSSYSVCPSFPRTVIRKWKASTSVDICIQIGLTMGL